MDANTNTKNTIPKNCDKIFAIKIPHERIRYIHLRSKFVRVGAEGEKTICYIVFDGFRRQTPDCSEPNGDGRITVSTRAPSRTLQGRGFLGTLLKKGFQTSENFRMGEKIIFFKKSFWFRFFQKADGVWGDPTNKQLKQKKEASTRDASFLFHMEWITLRRRRASPASPASHSAQLLLPQPDRRGPQHARGSAGADEHNGSRS